jgi:hypothetical protein
LFTAKDPGQIFTKYNITVTQRKNSTGMFMPEFNITVRNEKNIPVDNLRGITQENYAQLLPLLEYFDVQLTGTELPTNTSSTSVFSGNAVSASATLTLNLDGGKVPSGLVSTLTPDKIFEAISLYYKNNARLELEDMLSYPISIILDGNYPMSLKYDIIDFINDVRDDVHFMLTRARYKEQAGVVSEPLVIDEMLENEVQTLLSYKLPEKGNVAIFAPDIARVSDPSVEGYVNVSSIYELAYKIPYNDYNYGI